MHFFPNPTLSIMSKQIFKYTLWLYKECQGTPRRWKEFLQRIGDFYGCPLVIMFGYLRDYKTGKDPKNCIMMGKAYLFKTTIYQWVFWARMKDGVKYNMTNDAGLSTTLCHKVISGMVLGWPPRYDWKCRDVVSVFALFLKCYFQVQIIEEI